MKNANCPLSSQGCYRGGLSIAPDQVCIISNHLVQRRELSNDYVRMAAK